jgi:hypothetical protein
MGEIGALMRAVAIEGIARAIGFNDYSLASLFDIKQTPTEPIHILGFQKRKALHKSLIHIGASGLLPPHTSGSKGLRSLLNSFHR